MSLYSNYLYTREQVRVLDKAAIENCHIPGLVLMERAGYAVFKHVMTYFPSAKKILVIAGPGNNGGDAYIVARLLKRQGIKTMLYFLHDPMTDEAKLARRSCEKERVVMRAWHSDCSVEGFDIIVDGLLGTGGKPLEGLFLDIVRHVNQSKKPVIAIDVPTGL